MYVCMYICDMQSQYQETAMKEFDNKLTLERKEKQMRDAALKERQEQFKYEKKAYLNKLKEVCNVCMYVCMYVCHVMHVLYECVYVNVSPENMCMYVCLYVCM